MVVVWNSLVLCYCRQAKTFVTFRVQIGRRVEAATRHSGSTWSAAVCLLFCPFFYLYNRSFLPLDTPYIEQNAINYQRRYAFSHVNRYLTESQSGDNSSPLCNQRGGFFFIPGRSTSGLYLIRFSRDPA
jgi:hypothetical protein